jgi:putative membrane protein
MNRMEFLRLSLVVPFVACLSRIVPAMTVTAAEFVEKAGIAGNFEIASSEIAAAETKREDVKAFAQQMIKDHTVAGEELKTTAAANMRCPPGSTPSIRSLSTSSRLQAVSYVKMQVEAHKEAVELFSAFSKHGDDAALQAFAFKTLPTLEHHCDMIQKISATQA